MLYTKSVMSIPNMIIGISSVIDIIKITENRCFTTEESTKIMDVIKTIDEEYINMLIIDIVKLLPTNDRNKLINMMQVTKLIIYENCYAGLSEEYTENMSGLLKSFEQSFKTIESDNDRMIIGRMLNSLGNAVYEVRRDQYNAPNGAIYVKPVLDKDVLLTEAFIDIVDMSKAYVRKKEEISYEALLAEPDPDRLIHNLSNIPKYVESVSEIGLHEYEFLHRVIWNAYNALINNISGLKSLSNNIDNAIDKISEGNEFSDKVLSDMVLCIDTISSSITNNINSSTNTMMHTSIINDLGLDFIYDILPENEDNITESNADDILTRLSEAAETYDVIEVLDEGFVSRIMNDKSDLNKENRNIKLESKRIKTVGKANIFVSKKNNKQERKDSKLDAKSKRNEDTLDTNHKDKLEKVSIKSEHANQKLKDRLESRDEISNTNSATKISNSDYWKTAKSSNENIYKANKLLKKLVKTALVGAAFSFTAISPILAAVTYFIISSSKSHRESNAKMSLNMAYEIQDQISSIDQKIDYIDRMDQKNPQILKKKIELTKFKNKLERTLSQIGGKMMGGAVIK